MPRALKMPEPELVHPALGMIFYECILQGFDLERIKECTGISSSTLSRWRQGETSPTLDQLQALTDMLNCEIKIHRVYKP